ncbi:hypothetical protein B0I37DRAFT_194902 [Chaetomium sp. MPI-CAGE-AT-0009]|nr:hypothetical protein B0I37DRAFT_194902 [Chaetomium sp. MPI-CAGE-AT-0009]
MKLAAITAAIFSMGALAAPNPRQDYQYSDLEWRVETSPGHTVTVNGTIEALVTQLLQQQGAADPDTDSNAPEATTPTIARRTADFSRGSYYCGGPWPYAHMAAYWEGLRYLRSITGEVRVPPGPRMCSRVSCSYGAAVWICNDRTDELRLDAFARIADGVSYIIGRCATTAWGTTQVAGQVFHPDLWNVIVRRDDC